jgi:hypothetical protein
LFNKKYDKVKINRLLSAVVAFLCVVLPVITLAQGPPDPEDTPIDGGLSLLVLAGAAYGIKKYHNYSLHSRKKQKL